MLNEELKVGDISVRVAIADAGAETRDKIILELKSVLLEILAKETGVRPHSDVGAGAGSMLGQVAAV